MEYDLCNKINIRQKAKHINHPRLAANLSHHSAASNSLWFSRTTGKDITKTMKHCFFRLFFTMVNIHNMKLAIINPF